MIVFIVKALSRMHAIMPESVSNRLGEALGLLLYGLLGGKRKRAEAALARSFPDWDKQRVRQTTRSVFVGNGRFFAEVLRLHGRPRRSPLDLIDYRPEDMERFRAIMAQGHGALVLTAHVHNYIYLAAWAARFYPMTVVAKPIRPPALNDYILKVWGELGITVLPHAGTYRKILRAVQGDDVIGFVMDQNAVHKRGVFVSFFDRPACTNPGLAMLSAQSGAPVVPVFLVRDRGRYRVRIHEAIPPPPDRELDTLQDYTQRYTQVIEQEVREQPESWIWMHNRWRTAPRPGDRITRTDGSCYRHE